MLYGILHAIILGWLSWEDMKHLRIPVIGLIGLSCIGFSEILISTKDIWPPLFIVLSMYTGLQVLNYTVQYVTKSPAIGQGDAWLMGVLASRLHPEHIPIFLLLVGILSWVWGMYWTHEQRKQRFPMVPAITVAFIVARVFL
jgi:prepilin signal peptidase PulO-like enzyme (type II secretory pathway)